MKKVSIFLVMLVTMFSLCACGTEGQRDPVQDAQGGLQADGDVMNDQGFGTNGNHGQNTDFANGNLRERIPDTDKFDLDSGIWTEQDGYGVLLLTEITPDRQFDYLDDLYAAGYSGNGGRGWDAYQAEINDFGYYDNASQTEYMLRTAYCGDTQTFAIIVGELPMNYTSWLIVGLTEDQIGEPCFEGRVYDYIPDQQGDIYLYYTEDGYSEGCQSYQVCDVDRTRLEKYLSMLADNGYVETCREESDGDSLYYEGNLKVYKEYDIYVTVQIGWNQGKMMIAYSEPGYRMEKEDVLSGAMSYTGTLDGRDPYAEPEGGYAVIDLSQAVTSEWNGYLTKTLEGVEHGESVLNYIQELYDQGYCVGDYGRYAFTMDNMYTEADRVLLPLTSGDESEYLVIAYRNGTMTVIYSDEIITIPEAELCDAFGFVYRVDEYFLRATVEDLFYGAGMAYSTSGVAARFEYGTLDDYKAMCNRVMKAGYTNIVTDENADGVHHFCAYRELDTNSYDYQVYAHVYLVGDHLEVQVALTYETEVMGQ